MLKSCSLLGESAVTMHAKRGEIGRDPGTQQLDRKATSVNGFKVFRRIAVLPCSRVAGHQRLECGSHVPHHFPQNLQRHVEDETTKFKVLKGAASPRDTRAISGNAVTVTYGQEV